MKVALQGVIKSTAIREKMKKWSKMESHKQEAENKEVEKGRKQDTCRCRGGKIE
jgi:hypothetical protein